MASSKKVRGLLVEIGGDTTKLQTALKNVDKTTSNLSKELRGINTLLKFDSKNTELLGQKTQVLSENIKETEKRLDALKQAQEKLDSSGIDKNSADYRDLQREIINTQNKLSGLKNEASNWTKASNAISAFGDKVGAVSNKLNSMGNTLTLGITTPIVALGIYATKSAIEIESSMQQVNKIYGQAAKSVEDFAENQSIAFNMSTKDAYKYAQVFGNLIQTITTDQELNAQYTQELLKASSVIASSTGRTMEDVMDRIRSGLLGNTEAIEDLGVNVNVALLQSTDAFREFAGDKSWNQLGFQTQQQIRLFGILEQTTKKYGTEVNKNTASSIQALTAKTQNLVTKLGTNLLPIGNKLIDKAGVLIDKLGDLTDEEVENIVKTGLMVAAIGPLLKVLGTLGNIVKTTTTGIATATQAIGYMKNGIGTATGSAATLAKGLTALTSPAGLATIAVTAVVGTFTAMSIAAKKAQEEVESSFDNIGEASSDFIAGIDSATSHLDTFNETMFATSEEQQKLQENMDEVQAGITEIAKRASEERREYTQDEIAQLEEYFTKLRELKNKELEIQSQIAGAVSQQASTVAQTHKGTLDEYKVISQEWIKTAQDQADKQIGIIQNGTIEEIALLNQKYGEKATMDNEEYAREYNLIQKRQTESINAAQAEVAAVNSAFSTGYSERVVQDEGFYNQLKSTLEKQETLQSGHTEKIRQIKDGELWHVTNKQQAISSENATFAFHQKNTWEDMYKNMDASKEKQLGVWLAMVAQTELYGGNIDEETKQIVNGVISSYDSMPEKTRESMKNAMSPMLDEMQKSEPTLFAKASGIANGILSRLRKSFQEHSPSKATRKIFKYVMEGAELGLKDEEKDLYNQVEEMGKNVLRSFSTNLNSLEDMNMADINQRVTDSTKYVFTQPNIVFNVQQMDEANLNVALNYINRRLGTAY